MRKFQLPSLDGISAPHEAEWLRSGDDFVIESYWIKNRMYWIIYEAVAVSKL